MARRRKPKKRNPRAFKPFKAPVKPPPNTYDPALDSQERATARGLADTVQDTGKNNQRAFSDLLLARGQLARQRSEGLADIARRRTQEQQDYGRNVAGLNRSYHQLGNRQAQAFQGAGLQRGGALAQAARKRTANYQIERQPLDTNFARFNEQSRLNEVRLGQDIDRRTAALGVDYQRGTEDRNLALARARRENTFYGQDVSTQRFYQAKGTGYTAPTRPKGEYVHPRLGAYRTNNALPRAKRIYTLPSGRRFNRRQWVAYDRRKRRV